MKVSQSHLGITAISTRRNCLKPSQYMDTVMLKRTAGLMHHLRKVWSRRRLRKDTYLVKGYVTSSHINTTRTASLENEGASTSIVAVSDLLTNFSLSDQQASSYNAQNWHRLAYATRTKHQHQHDWTYLMLDVKGFAHHSDAVTFTSTPLKMFRPVI